LTGKERILGRMSLDHNSSFSRTPSPVNGSDSLVEWVRPQSVAADASVR
jgi:hypothetical protein